MEIPPNVGDVGKYIIANMEFFAYTLALLSGLTSLRDCVGDHIARYLRHLADLDRNLLVPAYRRRP